MCFDVHSPDAEFRCKQSWCWFVELWMNTERVYLAAVCTSFQCSHFHTSSILFQSLLLHSWVAAMDTSWVLGSGEAKVSWQTQSSRMVNLVIQWTSQVHSMLCDPLGSIFKRRLINESCSHRGIVQLISHPIFSLFLEGGGSVGTAMMKVSRNSSTFQATNVRIEKPCCSMLIVGFVWK